MTEYTLRLQIRVVQPQAGVQWCLQKGASERTQQIVSSGADLDFNLDVRAQPADDGGVRFLGAYTQGPVKGRFIYVCSGTSAGQFGSCWTRRAKVPLSGISWPMVVDACSTPDASLSAEFEGTARDGGPACATVKLLQADWRITR